MLTHAGVRVLGFDVRGETRKWTEADRNLHLIIPSVSPVLSVDVAVWPPVVTEDYRRRFWGLLFSLDEAIAVRDSARAGSIVAFSCAEDAEPFRGFPRATPMSPQDQWRWLGCDITDSSLTTFLSNMSVGSHRADLLAVGAQINRHGLLESPSLAEAAISVASALVPSHAPFFSIGVWLIDTSGELLPIDES